MFNSQVSKEVSHLYYINEHSLQKEIFKIYVHVEW
jgi:hypothetical protein